MSRTRKGRRSLPDRFWSKVDRSAGTDGCWPWTSSTNGPGGYGTFSTWRDGKTKLHYSHRIAWSLSNAREIPVGLIVLHSCDNPPCCNPGHLSLGTHQDNMDDMYRKGRHPQGKKKIGDAIPTGPKKHVLRKDSTTGYRGVSWDKNHRFFVQIQCNKRRKMIAAIDSAESAARIYDAWAREAFGDLAWINFP